VARSPRQDHSSFHVGKNEVDGPSYERVRRRLERLLGPARGGDTRVSKRDEEVRGGHYLFVCFWGQLLLPQRRKLGDYESCHKTARLEVVRQELLRLQFLLHAEVRRYIQIDASGQSRVRPFDQDLQKYDRGTSE
jgi:hypothetical protein